MKILAFDLPDGLPVAHRMQPKIYYIVSSHRYQIYPHKEFGQLAVVDVFNGRKDHFSSTDFKRKPWETFLSFQNFIILPTNFSKLWFSILQNFYTNQSLSSFHFVWTYERDLRLIHLLFKKIKHRKPLLPLRRREWEYSCDFGEDISSKYEVSRGCSQVSV